MSHRATYEEVKDNFDKIGLELLSTTFKRGKDYLDCRCKVHQDNIFKITYESVKDKKKKKKLGCIICQKEKSRITYSDEEYDILVKKVNPHITLISKYNNVKNSVRYICNNHTDYIYEGKVCKNSLTIPFQCPICKNGHENIEIGKTDIKSTNPVIYELLVDKSVNEKFNIHSSAKIDIRCPSCNNIIKNKSINHVVKRGFRCKCMDGNSQGEKFFYSVITQLEPQIDVEYYIGSNRKYRYDFHGIKNNIEWIVEIMGKQHSVKSFETCGGRTLSEEIENDKVKRDFALRSGIDLYITIDSENSGYNELKEGILKSDLSKIYDFSNIDWISAYRDSLQSNIIKACNYWNNGYKVMEICKLLDVEKGAVRSYLTKGNEIGLCDYDHTNNNRTKVICVNTGEIFRSQRDAERKYNLHKGYLFDYLTNKRQMFVDGVQYKWRYCE